MLDALKRFPSMAGKIASNLRLLRDDPERLARNLTQFTRPALFEQRLIDMVNAVPMRVRFDHAVQTSPRLNVLDAAWTNSGMTGGPNTAINLACRVARLGIPVRFVATVRAPDIDPAWFREHAAGLLGADTLPDVAVASAVSGGNGLPVGPGDVFLATHWSTAQQLKSVLPCLPVKQFFYMLQEFEPGFHAWSSNYALAIETYGMDFWPIINERLLADYLLAQPFGRLADPRTRDRALVFEPATDHALFYPRGAEGPPRPRRLLFYARPTNARNMFGLGLTALRKATADPVFAGWEFLSIGARGAVPELALGLGHVLRPAPWLAYSGYGDLLRAADILLCPMLSPHTSYPVLEMVACGGIAVTNIFATKTNAALQEISSDIVAVEPSVAAFARGLTEAAAQVSSGKRAYAGLNMPRDWATSLDPVADRVAAIVRQLVGVQGT